MSVTLSRFKADQQVRLETGDPQHVIVLHERVGNHKTGLTLLVPAVLSDRTLLTPRLQCLLHVFVFVCPALAAVTAHYAPVQDSM
jgi:hypothetical protein